MAELVVERFEPAFDGLDTDTAPDYLARTKAPVLANFLVDRPGRLPMRGPINDAIDIYTGAVAHKPVGVWTHNNNLLIGLKANSATAVRDPWVAPYRRTNTSGDLTTHHTTLYHINLETRLATSVASATAVTTPGPRHTRLGLYTYGISLSGSADETVNGGLQRRTQLCRWDGTAVLPTSYASGVAPTAMQDVRTYLNRLFVLGGNVAGTTAAVLPSSLFWSDVGGPTAAALTEWQDDVSGLVNQLVVDSNDPSDFGVALAVIQSGLVIFKRRSIHVLSGRTPAQFSLRTFTTEQGCIDPRSVVEYADGVFFMSDQGFMYFDGAQLVHVSPDLRSTLLPAAIAAAGDNGVDGGFVTAGRLPNDYIHLSIGTRPATTESSSVEFSAIYHPPRKAWATLDSDVMGAGAPLSSGRGLSKFFVLDDQKIFMADAITAPERALPEDRGFDVTTTILTFDVSGGGPLFNGAADTLKNQLTAVQAWAGVGLPIPARWHSRLATLGQPDKVAQLHRLLVDYTFRIHGAADDEHSGWYIELVDGRENVLFASAQLPAQGGASTYQYRRQFVAETFFEANDAQLRVEWRGTQVLPLVDASVLSAFLEFQVARLRGSS